MLDKLREQCLLMSPKNPEKYAIIRDILANDNAFFEIDSDIALSILKDLGVKEQDLNKVYLKLIK